MSTSKSKSEFLARQYGRVNSAKHLSTDWDCSQSASSLSDSDETEERKLAVLIEWLNTILPDLKLPLKASIDELRDCLADGTVLLQILRKVKPRSFTKDLEGVLEAEIVSPSQNVHLFLDNIDERGIPKFEMGDLEKGSMKRVVDCLLSIRVRYPTGRNNFSSVNGRMTRSGSLREFSPYQSLHLGTFSSSLSSPGAERQPLYSESKFQQFLRTSPALSESSAAWMHHAGHRFHEVFQVRQGRYADLSPSKISEMMKSTSLDNAPTQSLLSVVNGILDESIDRKNGEIPHRVACLLRKVVQEIERRISTQAEHLRTQNNLFKAREEKYQSRIRVLETLASGTGEEPAVIIDQLPPIKGVKVKMEDKSKVNEEISKLMKEKEQESIELARVRQELETTKTVYDDMVKLMRQKDETTTSFKLSSSNQQQRTNAEISALQQEVAAGKKELNHIVDSVRETDRTKNEQTNAEVLALQKELASTRKELDGIFGSMKEKDQMNKVGGDNVVRLLKEKEEMSLQVVALKLELERVLRQGNVGNDVDVVRLVKEKDDLSVQVMALKQELERVSRQSINVGAADVVRLVKEKEEMSLQIATLKQEHERKKQLGHGNVENGDVVRLVKEKEDMNGQIATLKQELERVKGSQGDVDNDVDVARLVKEKEEMSLTLSKLQQEMETLTQGNNNDADVARLMKENEEMSLKISSLQQEGDLVSKQLTTLQQEHEEMVRSMKEKDQTSHDQLSKLQQEMDSAKRELDGMARLVKEKDQANLRLAMSIQELEVANKAKEQNYLQLEGQLKEVQSQLIRSKEKMESDQQIWSKKQKSVLKSVDLQFHTLHELRFSSTSIKEEVLQVQQDYTEKFLSLRVKFKTLVDASENYYLVLAENRRLFNELQDLRGNIRVYCRVRPFLPGHQSGSNKSVVEHIGDKGELVVGNPAKAGKDARKLFRFNKVYGPGATQGEVYLDTQPLVQSVLDGYNVCIFAYGQTGSGKTYTMLGPNGAKEEEWGVNYRALKDLFNMSKGRSDSISYEVGVQMVEIYNEQVRDLLTNDPQKKLGILTTIPSNGVAVPDATMLPVFTTSDVMDLMQIGLNNRAVSSTAMNERSSRSHSVLSVHVKGKDLQAGTTLFGNLHLVDLAGSERIDRSEVIGDRLKEAQHINKSLSALGDVIFALAQKSTHVPYRNSKLTQLLQSSLGGQAKTLMFVQLNPDASSYSESLSTLKFAERVSGIELGAAKSNPGRDVKELMEQLASLKDTIANKDEEIERLQVLKVAGAGAHPPPGRLRTRRSLDKDSEMGGGDSESRYSDNYMSDGEASVGTEPESVHDDGGGGGRASSADKRTGAKGLTKTRSLQRLAEARPSTVSRDHLKGSTSVKKATAGSSTSTLQKPMSSSRSRRA